MGLVNRATRLLERARWKEEGWERPDPPDILRRYAEESGVYAVHMSDVGPGNEIRSPNAPDSDERPTARDIGGFKVGINPRAMYNTPKGVYCYPLNGDTYDRWFGTHDSRVPFAARRDWMYVLENQAVDRETLVIDPSGSSDFTRHDLRGVLEFIYQEERELVDEAAVDNGHEPEDIGRGEDILEHPLFVEALYEAKIGTPIGEFWNATRMIAQGARDSSKAPTLWNRLLREYGAIGTVVDLGLGLVHDNEPHQVVFLDPADYEPVDVTPNVWDWWDREEERRQNPERMKREEFGAHGLDDMVDVVDTYATMGAYEWAEIADFLAAHENVREFLKDVSEAGYTDGVLVTPTSDVPAGQGVRLRDVTVRDMRLPPWLPDLIKFSSSELRKCEFRPGFLYALDENTKPFGSTVLTMCQFHVPIEHLEEAAREGAGRELDDELISAIRDLLYDGETREVPGLGKTFKRAFGFDYLGIDPMFEMNHLEVYE